MAKANQPQPLPLATTANADAEKIAKLQTKIADLSTDCCTYVKAIRGRSNLPLESLLLTLYCIRCGDVGRHVDSILHNFTMLARLC
jgi:hypothetical protein